MQTLTRQRLKKLIKLRLWLRRRDSKLRLLNSRQLRLLLPPRGLMMIAPPARLRRPRKPRPRMKLKELLKRLREPERRQKKPPRRPRKLERRPMRMMVKLKKIKPQIRRFQLKPKLRSYIFRR